MALSISWKSLRLKRDSCLDKNSRQLVESGSGYNPLLRVLREPRSKLAISTEEWQRQMWSKMEYRPARNLR